MCYYEESREEIRKRRRIPPGFRRSFPGESYRGMAGRKKNRLPETLERVKMSNEIGVRYCGGCNTTYDRAAAVKQLQELLPDCSFVIAEAGYECRTRAGILSLSDGARSGSLAGGTFLLVVRNREKTGRNRKK